MPSRFDRPLSQDLAQALRRRGLYRATQAAWVVGAANECAKKRFAATAFKDGSLLVLSGTMPAAELQLIKEKLKDEINKKLGQEIIRTIRVKQG